jgi:hypothetical protein
MKEGDMPESDDLRDRIAHAIVFCEATLRALKEALRLIDGEEANADA